MKTSKVLLIFFFLISTALHAQYRENIILNGSFEGDFLYWTRLGQTYLSTYLASEGEKSYGISTNMYDFGFIYQSLPHSSSAFEANFSLFPQSDTYHSTFELVADWDGTTADFIARIVMKQDSIRFTTLQEDTTIQYQLQLNHWHHFKILTDSTGQQKEYYINNTLVCSQNPSQSLPVETVIIGDVSDKGGSGALHYDDIRYLPKTDSTVTNINPEDGGLPSHIDLKQNYPNPFNPNTQIEFTVSRPGHIKLSIYNSNGQKVRTLIDQNMNPGSYSIRWDATNDQNKQVSSGVYYLRLQTKTDLITKKMLLIQ